MMMVYSFLFLGLNADFGASLVEPKKPNSCKLESVKHGIMVDDGLIAWNFAIDDSSLFVGDGKLKTQYVPDSRPIVSPVYDSASKRIFWISFNQICEIDVKTHKSRSVYDELGLSGIGQIWMSNKSLMMRGASEDSCVKFDFHKERVIQKLVGCKSPM